MTLVKQLLAKKSIKGVYRISPESMVIDALALMAEHNTGSVLVMEDERLLGIFTERDYARKGILSGRKSKSTPVTEVMSAGVITVTPEMSVEECMHVMNNHRFRHLPVVDNDRVVGLISIGDLVRAYIEEQAQHIEFLEKYIKG